MTREEKIERLAEIVSDMNDDDLITLNNAYCEQNKYYDDRIYYMEEFDELMCGCSPLDILHSVEVGFREDYNYFKMNNSTGYWKSIDYMCGTDDLVTDEEGFAEWILDDADNFYLIDLCDWDLIEEILNDDEEGFVELTLDEEDED